jgi:lipid II:glycine glycyltransferase (peptidoglycan interpeptide bridge formation enzyme)
MVGGTMFANFADRAYLIYSGATDAGRDEGAPFLILFTALKELRASGYPNVNLGGAAGDAPDPDSADHGLHQFKTRFGAAAEPRTSGTLRLRPLRARAVERVRGLVGR